MTSYRSICDRIQAVQKAFPDRVALRYGDATMSYRELDQKANQTAGYLRQRGVTPASTVAICMERSFEWIVAALSVLRLGAVYVPLDPAWPDSRVRFAVADSGAVALIGTGALLKSFGSGVLGVDPFRDAGAIAAASLTDLQSVGHDGLAYLIYTSGSTGAPKGVELTHGNLSHLIDWHTETFNLRAEDCASHLAGLGFDAAVWEIWPTLATGACLCMADDAVRLSPKLMQQWILSQRVTIGFVPTVHASALIGMEWPENTAFRVLLTGGDALLHGPAHPLPFTVVNNYGPTECTVVATSAVVRPGVAGAPTIGVPIAGATVYLLNESGDQVEDGQVGELYIGGKGVGRGYRNLPESTTKNFLPDPFSGRPGARMYKTGDCGVRRSDGEIQFHGRLDRQVKIRGHRIELDEIGITLSQHPAVQFAVVTADGSADSKVQLLAYVLIKDGAHIPAMPDLHKFLLGSLPTYMVPGVFLRLNKIPLSPNGKLDLEKLPDAVIAPLPGRGGNATSATARERTLLSLMQDVLQNTSIGLKDNFFLAGGHSLLGMQLIMRLRSAFGVEVTLRQLLDAPTVEGLSVVVEMSLAQERLSAIWKDLLKLPKLAPDASFEDLGGDEDFVEQLQRRINTEFGRYFPKIELLKNQTVRKQLALLYDTTREKNLLPPGIVALQSEGNHNSLFWLHYPCLALAKAMGADRPFLCLMLTEEDLSMLGPSPKLQQVARCLVPKILKAQPRGPYLLGGFCLGGILSYEVACQMQAAGHEISKLILLDAPSPEYFRPGQIKALVTRPAYVTRRLKQLGPRRTVFNLLGRATQQLSRKSARAALAPLDERVQSMLELAASVYNPSVFNGKATLIMASELPPNSPPHDAFLPWWNAIIKQEIQTEMIPGLHEDLVKAPAVYQVAHAITSHLVLPQEVLA